MTTPVPLQLRPMTTDDIGLGMRLVEQTGWNQTEADWRRFLDVGRDGCFVAEWEGIAVGTTTTAILDGRVGWIAMVLVDPQYRRRGIGSTLLQTAIEYLEGRGVETIKLDATAEGHAVYRQYGFTAEYTVMRWEGVPAVPAATEAAAGTDTVRENDLEELIRFDAERYGVSRGSVLQRLFAEYPRWTALCREDGDIKGYGCLRPGSRAMLLGPVVATSVAVARRLIHHLLHRAVPQQLFWDTPLASPDAVQLTSELGLKQQRTLLRMFRGRDSFPGIPAQVFATSGPEKG